MARLSLPSWSHGSRSWDWFPARVEEDGQRKEKGEGFGGYEKEKGEKGGKETSCDGSDRDVESLDRPYSPNSVK